MPTDKLEPIVTQEELLPLLPEDADPDVYIVIPVKLLASRLQHDWYGTAREHRGEVRLGWLSMRFMRSLMQLGFTVDTKHPPKDKL